MESDKEILDDELFPKSKVALRATRRFTTNQIIRFAQVEGLWLEHWGANLVDTADVGTRGQTNRRNGNGSGTFATEVYTIGYFSQRPEIDRI
jgi:hypothetical protein